MQRFRTQGGSNLYLPLPVCLSLHGTFIYHRYFVAFILAECFNTDTVEMVYVQWVSAAKPKSNSTPLAEVAVASGGLTSELGWIW